MRRLLMACSLALLGSIAVAQSTPNAQEPPSASPKEAGIDCSQPSQQCASAAERLTVDPAVKPLALLRARIVQLDDQVRQLQAENAILRGQLAQATWPQVSEASRKAHHAAETEAGCPIDWTQTPPTCKPKEPAK